MKRLAMIAALTAPLLSCNREGAALDPNSFGQALTSATRSPDIRPDEDLYAPLVGVWEVDTLDLQPNGTFSKGHGEWLFSRALEGRAFQDVWIMPKRNADGTRSRHLDNRYGTTVRTMDPKTRQWQIAWFNPVTGAFDVLHAHRDGNKIVHEGTSPGGQRARWVFDVLEKDHFHWYGELEQPDGSWKRVVEFNGVRRADVEP